MENKKIVVSLMSALLILLCLAGCSSQKSETATAAPTEATVAPTEATVAPTEAPTEATAEITAEITTEITTEVSASGIGSTITFSQMEITFNRAEVFEKDAYNTYVVISVTLNNLAPRQNYIGGSQMTITDADGNDIMQELFDVGDYNNIVNAKPMEGESAEAYILMLTKEAGPFTITFDDIYIDDDEPVIVDIVI